MLVDARDIDVNLERPPGSLLNGRLSGREIAVRISEHETGLSKLDGRLAFDGTALALEDLAVEAPEGRLRVNGKLSVLPAFALDGLRYQGHLDLARMAPWVGADPPPTGLVSFSGTAAGPIDSATTTIDVAGDNLQWSDVHEITLRTHAVLSGSAAAIESLRVTAAGGEILADARVPFDDRSPGHARLNWRNLRVRPLVSALAGDTVPGFASVAEGSATFDWSGQRASDRSGHDRKYCFARTTASRGELPLAGRATLRLDDGIWQLSHDHRVGEAVALTGHAEGRIDPKTPASSTLSGSAELRVGSLSDAVALATKAGLADDAGGAVQPRRQRVDHRRLSRALSLHQPRPARSTSRDLRYGNAGPGVATGRYSASLRRILVDPLQVVVGANTIVGPFFGRS